MSDSVKKKHVVLRTEQTPELTGELSDATLPRTLFLLFHTAAVLLFITKCIIHLLTILFFFLLFTF